MLNKFRASANLVSIYLACSALESALRINKNSPNIKLKTSMKDVPSTIMSLDYMDLAKRFRDNVRRLKIRNEHWLHSDELFTTCLHSHSASWMSASNRYVY